MVESTLSETSCTPPFRHREGPIVLLLVDMQIITVSPEIDVLAVPWSLLPTVVPDDWKERLASGGHLLAH